MNPQTLIESPCTWKFLLCQSFKDTPVKTDQSNTCSIFNVHRFVYKSLQNSGIENRSPFSIRQLLKIRISSKGDPKKIRDLCIKAVTNMQKPTFCLYPSYFYFVFFAIITSLFILLTPITANTFNPDKISHSILKTTTLDWQDIESEHITLPFTSDYIAVMPYKPTPVEKSLEKLKTTRWILKQTDSSYSLQLLSVSNKSNLMTFCEKYNICKQSAIYSTQVNGKKIVRLIYGAFKSHKAATLAKADLSMTLKNINPWVRPFKQIKNEL